MIKKRPFGRYFALPSANSFLLSSQRKMLFHRLASANALVGHRELLKMLDRLFARSTVTKLNSSTVVAAVLTHAVLYKKSHGLV